MRRGDLRNLQIEGKTLLCEYLGKGAYCTAWRHKNDVYLFVKDYMKEALQFAPNSRHIPKMERLEDGPNMQVFKTKYYKDLTSADSEAWQQYKAIAAAIEQAREQVIQRYGSLDLYRNYGYEIAQTAANLAKVKPALKRALLGLADAIANYGCSCTFEAGKRNFGVDSKGRLILRDICFDACPSSTPWMQL